MEHTVHLQTRSLGKLVQQNWDTSRWNMFHDSVIYKRACFWGKCLAFLLQWSRATTLQLFAMVSSSSRFLFSRCRMTASFECSARCSLAMFSSTGVGVLVRLHCLYDFSRRCFRFSAASSVSEVNSSWCTVASTSLLFRFSIMASFHLITWFRHFIFSVL